MTGSIEPDRPVVSESGAALLDLFCTTGVGVNFIDVAALLPKLTRDRIGFAPVDAVFLRD